MKPLLREIGPPAVLWRQNFRDTHVGRILSDSGKIY